MSDRVVSTLTTGSGDNDPILYEMCHTDNPLRPVSGGVAPTLQARLGTGGNNVPVLIENPWDVQSKHIHNIEGVSSSMCAGEKCWGGMAPIVDDGRLIQSENGKAATLYGGAGQGTHNGAVLVSKGFDSYNCCETGDIVPTLPAQNASRANGPRVYSFDSLASNSMKSNNPNSGCREVQKSKCIDTTNPDPSKNQGGIAIVTYAFEGNGQRPSHQGDGYKESDVMYTLNSTEQHGVCTVGTGLENDGRLSGTLDASYYKGCGARSGKERPCVAPTARIRRLTPLECERLQGLPDGWTDIDGATDSKRYKAIGNGMAQPCADYILSQIAFYAGGKDYE